MKFTPLVIALLCGAAPLARAASFYTPVSITSANSTAYFPISRLYQGPGVGYSATAPHDGIVGSNTWVTTAPGGFPSNYITVAGAPILIIDLGVNRYLSEISTWGYNTGNANGVKTFNLRFATAAEGTGNFGASIPGQTGFTANLSDITRHSHLLTPVTARYVEFTATSNYYSNGGNGPPPGGDRVGLGEIAFENTVPPVDPRMDVPATVDLELDGSVQVFDLDVHNAGVSQTLTISAASFTGANAAAFSIVGAPATVAAGAAELLQFSFNPTGLAGNIAATLRLSSNDPATPVTSVALSGFLHDPQLLVAGSLDFGLFAPGSPATTRPLALTNGGGGRTLTISSVTISGTDAAHFSVVSSPASLAPLGSGQAVISFDALGEQGNFYALLTLNTNDALTPSIAVSLQSRVASIAAGDGLRINEFLAANSAGLTDGDGNRPDWIELYNAGPGAVDVTGWHLTDRSTNLTKWAFPSRVIAENAYLVVFASGQNTNDYVDAGGHLHTNFNLSTSGEYLGLVRPDGLTIVSEFYPAFPAQFDDLSYGTFQIAGAPPAAGYLTAPTPRAANSASSAPGPEIKSLTPSPLQPVSGQATVITAQIAPRLAPVASATLRYRVNYAAEVAQPMTGDGTGLFTAVIPSSAYAAGNMLRWFVTAADTDARTSRAPAFLVSTGTAQSPQYFGTVIPDPAIVSGLPVFQWFTQNVSASHTAAGTRASAFFAGRFYDNIFVRQRGQATNGVTSQKFDFNKGDAFYVDDTMPAVRELNLNGSGSDSTYVRQPLGFETYRTAGHAACNSALWLMRVNGTADRVGVFVEQADEDFLKRNGYDPDGELYKMVQRANLNPALFDTVTGFEKKTGAPGTASLASLVAGLNQATSDARRRYVIDQLDLPQINNYLALRSITQDADDVRKNFYLYQDARGDGRWRMFPWDKDWTFGVTGDGGTWLPHPFFGDEEHSKQNANQWNVLYDVLFEETTTQRLYLRRLRTLMDTLLQPASTPAAQRILETRAAAIIAPAVPPLSSNISSITSYLTSRRNVLFNNYPTLIPAAQPANPNVTVTAAEHNPASGNQDHEFIRLTNNETTEIDITGWKITGAVDFTFAPGTVIERGGQLFVSPNTLAFRSRLTSPTGNEERLSAGPCQGHLSNFGETINLLNPAGATVSTFTTPYSPSEAQLFLVISEIMYHPEPDGEAEFVELMNISPTVTLNLAGVKFTAGIPFTFPPGATLAPLARVLIVKNTASFEAVYGTGKPVAGQFAAASSLDNGGDLLKLDDATGSTIREFRYDDMAPWPVGADGNGSLVLVAPLTNPDHSLPQNWRASITATGNPGSTDTIPFTGNPNADTDRDGLTDPVDYAMGAGAPLTATVNSGGGFTVIIEREATAEANIIIELSADLAPAGWLPAPEAALLSRMPVTGTVERLTFSVPAPAGPQNRLFVRSRVVLN